MGDHQAKIIKVTVDWLLGRDACLVVAFDKADRCANPRLGQTPQIGLDHGCNARVTPSGIRIGELDDRLTCWRNLYDARNNAV